MVPSAELRAAWDAEEQALEMEEIDAALESVVEAWTLPDASTRLRMRVAGMQRRAYELQAQDGQTPPGPDPLELDPGALGRLELPVLVLCGDREMMDFREAAERLAQSIPGARREVIPGAGHLAPMERPKAFRELLVAFLEEPRAPGVPT